MSDSDKRVEAWGRAYLADGDTNAEITEFRIEEEYRTKDGTGCETCGYGGIEYPYEVTVWGYVNGEYRYRSWDGTLSALIDLINNASAMNAALRAAAAVGD